MEKQSNGSLCFNNKKGKIFIFSKDNYERHCQKRDKLKYEFFLKELEKTLFYPDVITKGPQKNKNTYYKVFKNVNNKYDIQVRVLQIPVFRYKNRKKKSIYKIATTFDLWGFSEEIIHPIEKIIWQKKDSLI